MLRTARAIMVQWIFLITDVRATPSTEFDRTVSFSLKSLKGDSAVSASKVNYNFIQLAHTSKIDKASINRTNSKGDAQGDGAGVGSY